MESGKVEKVMPGTGDARKRCCQEKVLSGCCYQEEGLEVEWQGAAACAHATSRGDTLATIHVRADPPMLSLSSRVSLESR